MRSINLRSFKCLEPRTRTKRKITKWTLLRYKEIIFQVTFVLNNWNDKLWNNFKHVIGSASAGAGCWFFALGWETQALSTSACRPLHHPRRPKSLLTRISKCWVQTMFRLPGTCICCCVWAHFTTCEETTVRFFFLLYYAFWIRNTISYAWPT